MPSKISIGAWLLGMMFLGLIWYAMKPAIDEVIGLLPGMAGTFGMTSQELAYFSLLPFLIGGILVIKLALGVLNRRRGGG